MTMLIAFLRRAWRCRSGATAVEFALVCLPLFLMAFGIVEFGRAINLRNDLSYAADVAARKVLIGQIPAGATESEVLARLDAAVRGAFSGDPGPLTVNVTKETIDGVDFRRLSIGYGFSLMLPALSDQPIALELTRRVPIG